ncbi:hypothetical protein [Puia dinghuensis]|uniref:Uncharacterized protein n=1 Tax=Puia dinghuensis TaxID=1792502 RepID=A0A8J2UES3_9BACT|nr:hypothetical protein [Puia dinghuensis]GGB06271.1 hypothetical protein GCM10011511_32100 [Puia dinghuensis]
MTEKNTSSEDYISFAGLQLFFVHTLRFFFQCLHQVGAIFRKGYLSLTFGVILGALAGWQYYSFAGKNYKVSMLVEYNTLDKVAYMNIIDQLNLLVRSGSKEQLAQQLQLSPVLADRVNSLGTQNLLGQTLDKDATESRFFRIVAGLRSPSGADSIGEALINYINGLPYLKKEMDEQGRIWHERLDYLQGEMVKIDSLKKEYFDPASLYRQSNSLDSLKTEINNYLIHRDKALAKITAFRPTENPQSVTMTKSITAWTALGFVAAFIIVTLRELKKKINVI